MQMLKALSLFVLVCGFVACNDDGNGPGSGACNFDFDQPTMLRHLADKLIVPGYEDLFTKTTALKAAATAFADNPSEAGLAEARSQWLAAYLSWQNVAQYEFGPAEAVFLRSSVNNFPLDTNAVKANFQAGTYNFDLPDAYDKGFPALDYLLYGIGESPAAIVSIYTDGTTGSQYTQYLRDLVADIDQRVEATFVKWQQEYRDFFVDNTGTAAGTSLSLIINGFNQHYELIKREKLGIPSGVLTLGFANPDKVEAYFSGQSLPLAIAALEAAQRLYLGNSPDGANGPSLDDFLSDINAQKNNQLLADLIRAQFTTAINTLKALPAPLSATVENDQTAVQEAYNEVTKQLVNIKTDLPSVLCVSITYIDNPSDSD